MAARRTVLPALLGALLFGLFSPLYAQDLHFQIEALDWDRGDNDRPFDYFSGPADRLNPAADLRFGDEWGQRYRLFRDNGHWEMEGVYTRFEHWLAGAGGTLNELSFDLDPDGAQTPLSIVTAAGQAAVQEEEASGGTRINTAEHLEPGASFSSTYASQWNDAELNVKTVAGSGGWLKFGFGARYGNLDELFTLSIFGTFDDTPLGDNLTEELTHTSLTNTGVASGNVNNTVVGGGLTFVSGGGTGFQGDTVGGAAATASILDIDYDANVQNELIGAQVILQALFWEGRLFTLEGFAKGGVFLNHVQVTLTETYRELNLDLDTYRGTFTDNQDAVTFLGNVGMSAGYKLRENIRLKFGYEVQFLSGVALAADQWQQVQADNFGRATFQADTSGTIISHGGHGSLELLW